jgi:hypothetical protein
MIDQRPWATTTHNGRAWSCVLRLGTVLLLGGCATYQPMPLVSLTMGSVDDTRKHPVYSMGVTDRCPSDP